MRWRKQIRPVLVIAILLTLIPVTAWAQTSSSPSYRVEEAQFGTGGEVNTCSDDYCAQGSAGSLGVGSSSSDNFDAEAGFLTQSDPFLEFSITGGPVDLGTLDPGSTASGSSTFYIRAYLSESYSVITLSDPPTNGGVQLDPMTSTASPTPGTEQFGINLVDNATPDLGADPVNVPDDTFADGAIPAGYATPDQFRYNKGEVIAQSPATAGNQAVGRTNYTITYVANISNITEGGTYSMGHELAAVPTF